MERYSIFISHAAQRSYTFSDSIVGSYCRIFLKISRYEWLAVLLISALVFTAEGLNTALEILGDEIAEGKWKNLVGRAKDVSAGAVLIAALFAVIVGLVIFVPHILQYIDAL